MLRCITNVINPSLLAIPYFYIGKAETERLRVTSVFDIARDFRGENPVAIELARKAAFWSSTIGIYSKILMLDTSSLSLSRNLYFYRLRTPYQNPTGGNVVRGRSAFSHPYLERDSS